MTGFTHIRRRVRLALAAIITTGLLASCQVAPGQNSPTPDQNSASPVIGLTYIPNIQFAPFYVADHNRLFGEHTTPVLRHHGSSESLFSAIASGQEQFVVAGGDEVLQARSQGIDLVAVASYYEQYPARFIVAQGSPLHSVADLKGHTIGVPGRFGESWFALLVALQSNGLTQADVTIVEIGYTQQAALTTGKVDTVVGFANSDVLSFSTADFPVDVIDPKIPLVSICLVTTRSYAEEHPDTVSAVVAGMKEGMRTAVSDPAGTLTIAENYIPSFRGATRDTAAVVLPATTQLFTDDAGVVSPPFDSDQWAAMAEAMASVDLIPADTDPAQGFTNQFTA